MGRLSTLHSRYTLCITVAAHNYTVASNLGLPRSFFRSDFFHGCEKKNCVEGLGSRLTILHSVHEHTFIVEESSTPGLEGVDSKNNQFSNDADRNHLRALPLHWSGRGSGRGTVRTSAGL